jgi:hypothetical protein
MHRALLAGLVLLAALPAAQAAQRQLANDARFLEQTVPTSMACGAPTFVSLTVMDSGADAWTGDAGYALVPRHAQDDVWGVPSVPLTWTPSSSVVTFDFTVVAPSQPGRYHFQWSMAQDGALFGHGSPDTRVRVTC